MSDETTNGTSTTTEATPPPFAEAVAASAEAEAKDPREERSKPYEDRFLVPMTDEDRSRLLADMGALANEIDVAEATFKDIAKEHRANMDSKHEKLRDMIRTGREGRIEKHLRVVDVRILALNVLRIVREDTGEQVFERPLAYGERQADLFPKPEKTSEKIAEPTVVAGVDPAVGPDATVVATVEDGVVTKVETVEADRGDPTPAAIDGADGGTAEPSAPIDLASRRKKGRKKKDS